jgi:hypothetical protein
MELNQVERRKRNRTKIIIIEGLGSWYDTVALPAYLANCKSKSSGLVIVSYNKI